MQTITYANFRDKILRDMDLEQEEFISPTELIGYTNTAIGDAEALIHGLYEDYFLKLDTFGLTASQSDYDLPSDLYGDKLRRVLYNNPQDDLSKYVISQIKQFDVITDILEDERFRYILVNESAGGRKMRFYPTPTMTAANVVTRVYIRQANRIDDTADEATINATVIDIPEFQSYLYAHVKLQIARKEKLGQDIQIAFQHLASQAKLMEDTLTSRIPDEDNHVMQDLSAYYDFYANDDLYFNR